MSVNDDGGPAFPWGEHGTHLGGISMRDYFAAKAMQAIVTNDAMIQRLDMFPAHEGVKASDAIAQEAYVMADAMLKARK